MKPPATHMKTGSGKAPAMEQMPDGNALAVLKEISHALSQLVAQGETTVIDLCSIPFDHDDESLLDQALGDGELDATVSIGGEVRVRETSIPGVWRVERFENDRGLTARFIEITFMPEILQTQVEDVRRGHARLDRWIEERAKQEDA